MYFWDVDFRAFFPLLRFKNWAMPATASVAGSAGWTGPVLEAESSESSMWGKGKKEIGGRRYPGRGHVSRSVTYSFRTWNVAVHYDATRCALHHINHIFDANMAITCPGCKRTFQNDRSYSAHYYRCPDFKNLQAQMFETLANNLMDETMVLDALDVRNDEGTITTTLDDDSGAQTHIWDESTPNTMFGIEQRGVVTIL